MGLATNPMWVVIIRMRIQGQKARTDSTEPYYNGFIGNFVVVFLTAKYRQDWYLVHDLIVGKAHLCDNSGQHLVHFQKVCSKIEVIHSCVELN